MQIDDGPTERSEKETVMPTMNESSPLRADVYHPLDLHADAVEEWVAGLPLANVGETGRLLFTSLRDINASELTVAQRYAMLEALRATVHYLSNTLKQRFLGTAFPLPDKPRKIAHLLRELQLEMAKGYRLAAHQLLLQGNLRQDGDVLAAALQRSLYYFGQNFLTAYQIYGDPEPVHWREIYRLYTEAERRAVHLNAVRDRFKQGGGVTTIGHTFKQILLLTLADPLRLTQTEMAATYRLLETAADQCRLHKTSETIESPAFMVDLGGETPPVRLLYNDVPVRDTCRWLDTAALLHSIRILLTEAASDQNLIIAQTTEASGEKPPRNLLQRLLVSWGTGGKRVFTRLPYRSTATVRFGLSAGHEAAGEQRQDRSLATAGASGHCEIVNESAAGACLYWTGNKIPRVRVGEIVTLQHAADAQGGIGVVRWLSQPPGKGVFFGVQMLVPSATPIALRLSDQAEMERDYLKGLLLPPPPRESTQTLLTPAFVYRSGDVVSIRWSEQTEQRYRLTRVVESTQVFTRFYFEPLTVTSEEEEPPLPSKRRERHLDSAWSGL